MPVTSQTVAGSARAGVIDAVDTSRPNATADAVKVFMGTPRFAGLDAGMAGPSRRELSKSNGKRGAEGVMHTRWTGLCGAGWDVVSLRHGRA